MIYGYARVSTDGQTLDAQVKELRAAGAEKALLHRRYLRDCLKSLSPVETHYVPTIDRVNARCIRTKHKQTVKHLTRWFRHACAVLSCALLFFLWLEESRWLKAPFFTIKIERNSGWRIILAKHIFGDDLENYI
jgi:hypothetical protein